jgi:hypothetical protein
MLQPFFEVRRYRGDVVTHSHDTEMSDESPTDRFQGTHV